MAPERVPQGVVRSIPQVPVREPGSTRPSPVNRETTQSTQLQRLTVTTTPRSIPQTVSSTSPKDRQQAPEVKTQQRERPALAFPQEGQRQALTNREQRSLASVSVPQTRQRLTSVPLPSVSLRERPSHVLPTAPQGRGRQMPVSVTKLSDRPGMNPTSTGVNPRQWEPRPPINMRHALRESDL